MAGPTASPGKGGKLLRELALLLLAVEFCAGQSGTQQGVSLNCTGGPLVAQDNAVGSLSAALPAFSRLSASAEACRFHIGTAGAVDTLLSDVVVDGDPGSTALFVFGEAAL